MKQTQNLKPESTFKLYFKYNINIKRNVGYNCGSGASESPEPKSYHSVTKLNT